jgi:hypothetical protein
LDPRSSSKLSPSVGLRYIVTMSEAPPPSPSDAPDSKFVEHAGPQASTKPNPAAPKKRRRWLRRFLILLGLIPVFVLALWIAIHRIGWLGPWLADTGRSILGNDAIAKLEDWAYGAQDKFNQATRSGEKPKALWTVPPRVAIKPPVTGPDAPKTIYPTFEVKDVGPMLESFSAPGDGQWVPMVDARKPDEPPPMFKTLLHPDAKRGWASVAVAAIDMRQVELHLKAGTMEPMTKLKDAKEHKRTGLVSPEDLASVIAVFNGGFKTTHGNYGMKAEGILWVEPHGHACTIAMYPEDKLLIRSWEELESTESQMVWFRETPMCMFEQGEMHKGLTVENNTHWGATLDKDTVIRRSAIGLSEDGQVLYVGITEATTATAIAKAMHFAGAYNVAQLDVNWSYPKFFTVEPKPNGSGDIEVKPIVDGFEFSPDDYIKRETTRDFFYITRLAQPKSDTH